MWVLQYIKLYSCLWVWLYKWTPSHSLDPPWPHHLGDETGHSGLCSLPQSDSCSLVLSESPLVNLACTISCRSACKLHRARLYYCLGAMITRINITATHREIKLIQYTFDMRSHLKRHNGKKNWVWQRKGPFYHKTRCGCPINMSEIADYDPTAFRGLQLHTLNMMRSSSSCDVTEQR